MEIFVKGWVRPPLVLSCPFSFHHRMRHQEGSCWMSVLWSWTSQHPEARANPFLHLLHCPASGILLQQHEMDSDTHYLQTVLSFGWWFLRIFGGNGCSLQGQQFFCVNMTMVWMVCTSKIHAKSSSTVQQYKSEEGLYEAMRPWGLHHHGWN